MPSPSVDLRRYPGIRRLAADYAYQFAAVAPFFAGDPRDREAWTRTIARVQAHPRDRAGLIDVLRRQQARRGAPDAARAAAARLGEPPAVAIVTGQQAGLFGGPLFTLLKALTALKLAEREAADRRIPVVAVFWIDAEDHDWDEVRTCTVLDEHMAPHALSLPPHGRAAAPVGTVVLDETVDDALQDLERLLPPTEFRGALLEGLRQAYAPGRSMAEAFGRWLEQLLGPRGLVVYDASDPAAKPLAAGVFARELSTAGTTGALAARAGADLEARGYHAQVRPEDGAVSLFRLVTGSRQPIRRHDDGFLAGDEPMAAARLLADAAARPDTFTPNVLLRPIVQDVSFPTVAYVPGPNELGYLAQLQGVYEHFGVPMPLMYPRCTATLLDAGALRFLSKYDLPLERLQPQDEAALNELLEREMPPGVEASFGAAGATVAREMAGLIAAVPAVDPTLEGAARSTLKRMQQDLETLHGKVLQALKRRHDTARRQFLRTQSLAFPGGQPQERAIGFVTFLNLHGPALVDRLAETLPLDLGRHWIVSV